MQSPGLVLLSDQQALSRVMDIVANNVANSSTTGFKREGIEFDTLLEQPAPGQTLNFVVDRATYRDASTGPLETTSNPLDLAIQGSGYFEVQTPSGTRYTRGGSFLIDNQGQIVNHLGQPVLSDGGAPLVIPDTATDINVSSDGFITAKDGNNINLSEIGKIAVVKFDNEQRIEAQGNGLYKTNQTPSPATGSQIVQGAVEQSNVKPVTEMTEMIKIMRLYEQATNLISQENTRLNDALTKLSKTTV